MLVGLPFILVFSLVASLVAAEPLRRAFRPLAPEAVQAIAAKDPKLEGFLDWTVEGGLLKSILIPRTREFS